MHLAFCSDGYSGDLLQIKLCADALHTAMHETNQSPQKKIYAALDLSGLGVFFPTHQSI